MKTSRPRLRRMLIRALLAIVGVPLVVLVGGALLLQLWPQEPLPVSVRLGRPSRLESTGGQGQITLRWEALPGAVYYQVQRSDRSDGTYASMMSAGGQPPRLVQRLMAFFLPGLPHDVVAVNRFVDTSIEPGRTYYYRVAGWDGAHFGEPSAPASAFSLEAAAGPLEVRVDAARVTGRLERRANRVINLMAPASVLRKEAASPGSEAGKQRRVLFRRLRDELGFEHVRFFGIFSDSLGVYRETPSGPAYDWAGIDAVYDLLLAHQLKPWVVLCFTPRDLATDPKQILYSPEYISSPPRDEKRWAELVRAFTRHLVDRYGDEEVASWYFEVWEEPDLHLSFANFWYGTLDQYFRLYEASARAIKSVDPRLRVGGPDAASPETVEAFLEHVRRARAQGREVPVDFLSLHLYYSPLPCWTPVLERAGFQGMPVLYTEWGVSAQPGEAVHDLPYGAAWVVRAVMDSHEAGGLFAYWMAADELGGDKPPKTLFHGGYGLTGLKGLRKSSYWAFSLLQRLGQQRLALNGTGDGFGGLVEGWAAKTDEGTLQVLLANATYEQAQAAGSPSLTRTVRLRIEGLSPQARFRLRHSRIDHTHTNVFGVWNEMGAPAEPSADQLSRLRQKDDLELLEAPRELQPDPSGSISFDVELPMPAVSLVELSPLTSEALP